MNPNEVVYVGNVPKPATSDELAEFFKDCGKVIKVAFMRENRNDCRTKIGFVMFENEMQALKACSYDQTIFQWNRVIVMLVNDERHFWAGHTVVVRNIAYETSEEDLYESFGRYGMIESVQVPTSNFAYIGFKEKSAAHAAQRLNNTMLGPSKITVQVLQRNVRVRLEDFDSFKTPRVFNELMEARAKYNFMQDAANGSSAVTGSHYRDYDEEEDEDDDEDNRVYDPVTNRFYDKPKAPGPRSLSREPPMSRNQYADEKEDDDDDDDVIMPPKVQWKKEPVTVDLVSPNPSPEPDLFDTVRNAPEDDEGGEIRRRHVEFGKVSVSGIASVVNAAVRVENIPREVLDEDVIKYFDQFGHIVSIEISTSTHCLFVKNYTIVFLQESVAERVVDCFMRRCEFSGVVCTMFTMRVDEVLHDDPSRCVLVDYISNSITFEDVVDAFRNVGEVIYVKKTARNTTPTVVHFRNRVSIDRAKHVTKIDGDTVRVVAFSQDALTSFTNNYWKLKNASTPYSKKPLKNVRMMDIEMKEATEKSNYMIIKTVFNPNYRNPEPSKIKNEVVIYNCPTRTTLKDLRRHFINVAFVTEMRYEQSPYDTNTWKVFASFATFIDAFNAVRLKGSFQQYPIFKHMATDKPKLDAPEAIQIEIAQDDISVTKIYNCLVSHGGITFVDKVDHNRFIAICREPKTAKKIAQVKTMARTSCNVVLYRDILNNQNALTEKERQAESMSQHSISLDGILSINNRSYGGGRNRNEDSNPDGWDIPGRSSVGMDLVDDLPEFPTLAAQQPRPPGCDEELFHADPLTYVNPPAPAPPIGMPMFGMIPPRPTFAPGWAPGGPMHAAPPTIVPPPGNRSVFMAQPIVPPMSHGIFGGPVQIPIPNITVHQIQPQPAIAGAVSDKGDLRQYLAEKRNTRWSKPETAYDPTDDFDRQIDNLSSGKPKSSLEIEKMEEYIREKEREIQRRLQQLDRQDKNLSSSGNARRSRSRDRSRSVSRGRSPEKSRRRSRSYSPTDRAARVRLDEIAKEKIEVSRQLQDIRKSNFPNYRQTAKFVQLCEMQSRLDKEAVEIKRQLEAKKLWLAERARSLEREQGSQPQQQKQQPQQQQSHYGGKRFARAGNRNNRSRSSSRSSSRGRRRSSSRSSSRGRPSDRRRRNSRSRSNERFAPRRINRCKRRPESLMREMRTLGRRHESKADQSVFVGNIADGVRNEELRALFIRYGRIVGFDVSMRQKCDEVYIDFHQREDAFKALEMNKVKMCGRRLRVALNCRKPANRQGYTVIVEMPEPVPERDLYDTFESCGPIEFIWNYDQATVATVTFERPEAMMKALTVKELATKVQIIVREYVESER
uniref:Putative serine/arginine-rich splicing factor 4 n=1 Tax=Culex tarsalis TaxID=7177 RepID=A0A1Q3FXV8_CULTA